MGNSVPIPDSIKIEEFCGAEGVIFEEHIECINSHNRNTSSWLPPEANAIKGIVMLSHGVNEHSLTYHELAIELVKNGYAVYGIDHVGNGKSEGDRGLIRDHHILTEDFIAFCNLRRKSYNVPAFIIAHSMGTLVALTALERLENITAIVLSGSALFSGPGGSSPFGITCLYPLSQTSFANCLLGCTGAIDPRGMAAPIILDDLTSDVDHLAWMQRDIRRCKPIIMNKTGAELLKMVNDAKEAVPRMKLPYMCLHGQDDRITLPKSSEFIYKNSGTDITQRKIELIPKARHECYHEISSIRLDSIRMTVEYLDSFYNSV